MITALLALAAGAAVGGLFAALRLPVPAPVSLIGVVGILGVTLGYRAVVAL